MRSRNRVHTAPQWANDAKSCPDVGPSLQQRLSQLVSAKGVPERAQNGPERAKAAAPAQPADSGQAACVVGLAAAASPVPEPASSAAVPQHVLYPPPVPPYAPLRSAWPESALVDFVKQQALYPTDVNVRVGHLMLGEGAARSGLLHSISDEALANTTATPSSASFRFVQLLAEVCARTGAPGGSGRGPCDGEAAARNPRRLFRYRCI